MVPPLDSPLEVLLACGGDTRIEIDPQTGRNRYHCLPHPSDVIPFGSCTSSTVSWRGYEAAGNALQWIRAAKDWRGATNELANQVRQDLSRLLTIPDEVSVALGPSGTDVELLALALAAGPGDRPIVNIVVGPTEVGSGTPWAAAGCHYDALTPSGSRVTAGHPVDAKLASRVTLHTVDLRSADGCMLTESQIDASVVGLVGEAWEADALVLLHIVAHSKTGMHAPSLSCVERLQQINDNLVVVVDAAQGRFSRRGLRMVLRKDHLVITTGSKFYGGPPFSGALLVPPKYGPAMRQIERLPAGFADYFSAAEMPEHWTEFRRCLSAGPNLGAILRWVAALAEMEAYYQVSDEARLRVLRYFEAQVPRILGDSKVIRLMPVFPPVLSDDEERLLQSKTTVFGFWVTPPGAGRPLDKEGLKQLHASLNAAPATIHPSASPAVVQQFQVGQPVDLGPGGSVLRVALGGELITRVATDSRLGATLSLRLEWLGRQLDRLRERIEYLAGARSPKEEILPLSLSPSQATLTYRPVS